MRIWGQNFRFDRGILTNIQHYCTCSPLALMKLGNRPEFDKGKDLLSTARINSILTRRQIRSNQGRTTRMKQAYNSSQKSQLDMYRLITATQRGGNVMQDLGCLNENGSIHMVQKRRYLFRVAVIKLQYVDYLVCGGSSTY